MTSDGRGKSGELTASLDRLVHEPGRLGILVLLSAVRSADFLYILRETGLSKGNLSTHVGKLEVAGLVKVDKTFVDKMPRTLYRITAKGRSALRSWRKSVLGVVERIS